MGKTRRVNPNIQMASSPNVNHYSDSKQDDRDTQDSLLNKSPSAKEEKGSVGAIGSVRVIIDGDKPYIEVKSEKGWIRSDNTSTSGFSFKK